MEKFIVFTDFHAHLWNEFAKPDDIYVNTRFREQIETLEKILDIAREKSASIIFAGDMFHKRNGVDTRVFNHIFSVFSNNQDIKVYMISGNHDKVANKLKSDSLLNTFGYLPNVTCVSDSVQTISHDSDIDITLVPYGDEVEEIKDSINQVKDNDKINILVAHLGVEGSVTGKSSHRLEGAFSYNDLRPNLFDAILLGHYHKPQNFGNNINHMYVGSTMQLSFNEEGQRNGVVEVTVDSGNVMSEFIEIPTTKFITLDGDNLPEQTQDYFDNYFVRFQGSKDSTRVLEDVANKTGQDLSNVRVMVKEDYSVETRIEIDNSTDPVNVTEKYMKEYYPDSVNEALEVIKEVI